jgi:hypothetical protein
VEQVWYDRDLSLYLKTIHGLKLLQLLQVQEVQEKHMKKRLADVGK